MKRRSVLPELLSPAGTFECLVAAVSGGADAVYVGGKSFGARAFAGNFDEEELKKAVIYCHLHGVRLYVTVNTLLSDAEISDALAFSERLYLMGVDALIVADLGLVRELRERLPDMELHASTQMSVHNTAGADAAFSLGCRRVVLARELSRDSISAVTAVCKPEVEVFIHGAICVSTSGQCLFSSLVGGRSGNRGECAQPCRLPYGKGYPLSMSDMSLAGHVRELIESGVASLKIEGRMKSPDYVYRVTKIYRRLLDEGRNATAEEHGELKRVFSRGGFTDGYFLGKPQSGGMIGIRSEADKAMTRQTEGGVYTPTRVEIFAHCRIKTGENATLSLILPGKGEVCAVGPVPEAAKSSPLSESDVRARLSKMGNTFFLLPEENVSLELDGGLNLAPSVINALRREATQLLESTLAGSRAVGSPEKSGSMPQGNGFLARRTALFFSPKALEELDAIGGREFFDLAFLPLWRLKEYSGRVEGVYLPPTVSESEWGEIRPMLTEARERGVEYALVGNIGHIEICKELGFKLVGDFRLNVYGEYARRALSELGVSDCVLSAELTAAAVRRLGGRAILYGRIPLMLTERCFIKDNFGCDRCSEVGITDRKGVTFPIIREYGHRNIILNSAVTYMGDRMKELSGAREVRGHFIFTTESGGRIAEVIAAFKRSEPLRGAQIRRMGRRDS